MTRKIKNNDKILLEKIEELQTRLAATEETLNAIRNGQVDAIVVSGPDGEKVFTLASAETPYRTIVEEMQEGAVTISESGTILYCNRRFAELVSVPMEQIIGSNFNRFISEKGKTEYESLLQSGLQGRIKGETIYMCKDGDPVYLHLSFCTLPKGILGKICIIVTDVTELKKYQHDLKLMVDERTSDLEKANRQLHEMNATKDKLFSIIAHDLKGPFTTLLGFSDLLIENMQNYDIHQFRTILSHINCASKNAFNLLENLLMWARAKNKQLQFNPVFINLNILTDKVINSLSSLAAIKNISLNFSPSVDIICYADENMLRTVLRNLISNSIKFTDAGGKIEVTVLSNNQEVGITVSDNGIGMNESTKNRLFTVNADKTAEGTAHEKGTGLGLLICKEFVDKHRGKIYVDSTLGAGSKFTIILPRQNKMEPAF